MGRVVIEYGARPYGNKFKSSFKYDDQGRMIEEIVHDFQVQEFEHYKVRELYALTDTVDDFETIKGKDKTVYEYKRQGLTTEKRYYLILDSLSGKESLKFFHDTIYQTKPR